VTGRLRIQLLGRFQIWRDGRLLPPSTWPTRKACQVLKILITHQQRAVPGDELVEWLWPGLSLSSARNSLWVAVSSLRHFLEPEIAARETSSFIVTTPPGYRFDPAGRCELDVDTFLNSVEQGHRCYERGDLPAAIDAYLAARALYGGDYLVEDLYEDWAAAARHRLREALLEIEGALASCYLALARTREALVHAREVLGRDPGRESAWRLVMEAHYRAGEQDQALRAFEECRQWLSEELGVDPLPETQALHEHILRCPPALPRPAASVPSPDTPLQLPFVGRDREWLHLTGLLQRALDGHGQMVLISGEPGVGKTRLLEELAGLARARGARVLAGQGYELEQNVAYGPIVETLRPLLPALAKSGVSCDPVHLAALSDLLPEVRIHWPGLPACRLLPRDEERARLLAALSGVIRLCARGEPLVLLLDDLHWADRSTLQLVHHLGRQLAGEPLLLVCAYRSTLVDAHHPVAALRQQLIRQHLVTELSLAALQQDDLLLLLRILAGEEPVEALARTLYGETEGNPFFMTEVLRMLLQEEQILVDPAGRWHLVTERGRLPDGRERLPATIRTAVLGRLGRLPAEDRFLLDHASVIGREFSLPLMAMLTDRSEPAVALQADRLVARGFLQPRQVNRYAFGHELTRRTVYEELTEPRQRLLHRQAADSLLASRASSGVIASHYAASDRPWLALEHTLAAAEEAARVTAYDEAIAWCQTALEITGTHPTTVPPGFRTRLHLQWRTLWYYRGDLARTLAAGRAALVAARQEGDPTSELQALWLLAHDETQLVAGGPAGLQTEALALARDLGDPAAEARSLARLGSDTGFVATPAERPQALEALEQAVGLARSVGDPALLHHVLCELWGVGRLPQARAALEEALDLVRQLGDRREEVGTLAKLADLLARQGDLAAAIEYGERGVALAAEADSPTYGAWSRRALGQALVARGRVEKGVAHLMEAVQQFEHYAWRAMLAGTSLRLGLGLLAAGDADEAAAAFEQVLALGRETGEIYESAVAVAVLGEVRMRQGDQAASRAALAEADTLVPRIGLPWHQAGAWVHLAAGRLLLGEAEAALTAAEAGIAVAAEEDLRAVGAHGQCLRGQALAALGRPDEAQAALAASLVAAEVVGHARLGWDLPLGRSGL
jgi:DNA-binding SARP family transcriptional activator